MISGNDGIWFTLRVQLLAEQERCRNSTRLEDEWAPPRPAAGSVKPPRERLAGLLLALSRQLEGAARMLSVKSA